MDTWTAAHWSRHHSSLLFASVASIFEYTQFCLNAIEMWTSMPCLYWYTWRPYFEDRTFWVLSDYFRLWSLIADSDFSADDLEEDMIIWTLEPSGEYTARSAYAVQFGRQHRPDFLATIWKPLAPSCCKFLWLLLQSLDRVLLVDQRMGERLLLPSLWKKLRSGTPSHLGSWNASPDVFGSESVFGTAHQTWTLSCGAVVPTT